MADVIACIILHLLAYRDMHHIAGFQAENYIPKIFDPIETPMADDFAG
ncbi:hypothetical protein [Methanofollis aquaemaris]|nr:hypothetical protein [Methanofollis aquaemaris]